MVRFLVEGFRRRSGTPAPGLDQTGDLRERLHREQGVELKVTSLLSLIPAAESARGPAHHWPSSFNQGVPGSSPGRLTKNYEDFRVGVFSMCRLLILDDQDAHRG